MDYFVPYSRATPPADCSGTYSKLLEDEAMRLGALRHAAGAKLEDTALEPGPETHAFGALGELLVADYLGVPWSALNQGAGADDGFDLRGAPWQRIEVRTRDTRKGDAYRDLIVRESRGWRPQADVVVLVWIERGRRYTLAGWATEEDYEANRQHMKRRDGMNLWVVPYKHLNPMDDLPRDPYALDERAAILEFDAGMPRDQAEAEARRLLLRDPGAQGTMGR